MRKFDPRTNDTAMYVLFGVALLLGASLGWAARRVKGRNGTT